MSKEQDYRHLQVAAEKSFFSSSQQTKKLHSFPLLKTKTSAFTGSYSDCGVQQQGSRIQGAQHQSEVGCACERCTNAGQFQGLLLKRSHTDKQFKNAFQQNYSKSKDQDTDDNERLLKSQYALNQPEQLIGEGNYSKVYKVEIDGQFYAVKQLKRESKQEKDPEMMSNLENILNEVSVLSKSKNPRIIKLVGKYRTKDYYHIITEYCNGGSLQQFIALYNAPPHQMRVKESFAREIIKQIVEGLQYLHEERHVIHRDIKPANIMINWKLSNFQTSYNKLEDFQKALNLQPQCMEIKLADFGFARFVSISDQAMDQYGTPYYMAPEVLQSTCTCHMTTKVQQCYHDCENQYDCKADIWSLGVTMYELLNNNCVNAPSTHQLKYPFRGSDKQTLIQSIFSGKYAINNHELNLSPYCIDFMNLCLQVDPKNRASAIQLLNHPFLSVDYSKQREHYKKFYSHSEIYKPNLNGVIILNAAEKEPTFIVSPIFEEEYEGYEDIDYKEMMKQLFRQQATTGAIQKVPQGQSLDKELMQSEGMARAKGATAETRLSPLQFTDPNYLGRVGRVTSLDFIEIHQKQLVNQAKHEEGKAFQNDLEYDLDEDDADTECETKLAQSHSSIAIKTKTQYDQNGAAASGGLQ